MKCPNFHCRSIYDACFAYLPALAKGISNSAHLSSAITLLATSSVIPRDAHVLKTYAKSIEASSELLSSSRSQVHLECVALHVNILSICPIGHRFEGGTG